MPAAFVRRLFLAAPLAAAIAAFLIGSPPAVVGAAEVGNAQVDPRLKALVGRHLRARPGYLPGDLLSRSDVEPIFNELLNLGVSPTADGESLYSPYLRNDVYLVQLFETPAGRAFVRKVNTLPDAYDRLERLSWSTGGRTLLQQLVEAENGDKLFADMLTENGMKAVAESLKDDPSGRNFQLQTGHAYTEDQLLARLHRALTSSRPKSAATTN